jgi:D-alanyl-D-alanine carboxypeptidase (penicillin-binding protein 5/6)
MTLIAQVGKAAFDYFTKGAGAVDAPQVARTLRMGQDDPLVVPLQRTLNERLKPSPELSDDGDFGPNTENAVKAFQKQSGLKPTGVVDGEFWKALGPLVLEKKPVPPPEEAMKDLAPLLPQDSPSGPPIVSCKAWAIADGETGKVLWGGNENGTRDPASTTKMMTAYVVLKLADADPKVLDEVITFTERADKTSGSTSDVNAGEKVSVRELLYGLMLPSGNDASVAFAEHFGARLPGADDEAPYDRFIAKMNATAKELGMDGTGYRNTHGLTAKGHVTTASDLVKLAHAAMQNELFRKVVATRRYATTLESAAGYQRNIVWNNTDQLLNYEGFYGIKTGTTDPAGACLVSAGKRGDKPLYVVVLGATGATRYLDARNLYHWAWNQLGVE